MGVVTGELFPTLGVAPLLGRTLAPGDDRLGAAPVAVISEGLWQ
jgi:putative ABC transport system permease protein